MIKYIFIEVVIFQNQFTNFQNQFTNLQNQFTNFQNQFTNFQNELTNLVINMNINTTKVNFQKNLNGKFRNLRRR